jgi:heme A synthase
MTLLRRVSYGALALAFAHIVFGAIVRITGSGLGCGDHWPQCHGYWFPPFTRMDLVIEVMHRYLAFGLSVTIAGLLLLAFSRRRVPGVSGRGGVLRPIALAAVLVVTAAVFGGVVVKLELRNKYVIVVHLAIAISTLASLAMAAIRAGGLGGAQAIPGTASPRVWRSARAAAVMAFVAVVLGGLTAHVIGANGACVGFPHCPRGIPTPGAPLHIHLTHRFVAFALFFHLLGMVMMVRKRRESPLIQWATRIAFGTVVLQILVAAALVELHLPPVLRSLHQAVGTLVWLSIFVLAALARRGSRDAGDGALLVAEPPRLGQRLQHFAASRDYFLANAVAGDRRDLVRLHIPISCLVK